ncbi:hypothetical protein HUJ05_012734 [Dendroctonus ponderosae]|nr:hypothetical protein HUJ05_012734 [Dendroctonus ponderosae]
MYELYINVCMEDGQYLVDIKTFLVLTIYKLSEACDLRLKVKNISHINGSVLACNFEDLDFDLVHEAPELAQLCTWPVILLENYVISGLCSVARQICRTSEKQTVQKLLGFRGACLVTCAESSVWTQFCEIDITCTINKVLSHQFLQEGHFNLPVRIHNIYKIARNNLNDQSLISTKSRADINVLHDYAEGPYFTLADFILYPCFQVFFKYCQYLAVEPQIPLINAWFDKVQQHNFPGVSFQLSNLETKQSCKKKVIVPEIPNVSLYTADPTRALSGNHTNQNKIEAALSLIDTYKADIANNVLPFGFYKSFDWYSIPLGANPQGGALPAKRAARKCEQLENLVKATLEAVGDKTCRIVDFCSGSGHLGILIALALPKCKVILVENKEMSLARAKATIAKLHINNVIIVQSNLDYFTGTFDLGLALHACGVATDLVLEMCIKNHADFVCCPCCYGGIKDCHEVSYPRSAKFQAIFRNSESNYFNLAHAADQTHNKENSKTTQGYFCMDVIDSDRRCYAEDSGYTVHLGKLQPETCTNKNNLLVGIYKAGLSDFIAMIIKSYQSFNSPLNYYNFFSPAVED